MRVGAPRARRRSAWAWLAAQRESSSVFSTGSTVAWACKQFCPGRSCPSRRGASRSPTERVPARGQPPSLIERRRAVPLGRRRPDLGIDPLRACCRAWCARRWSAAAPVYRGAPVFQTGIGRDVDEADVLEGRPHRSRTGGRRSGWGCDRPGPGSRQPWFRPLPIGPHECRGGFARRSLMSSCSVAGGMHGNNVNSSLGSASPVESGNSDLVP